MKRASRLCGWEQGAMERQVRRYDIALRQGRSFTRKDKALALQSRRYATALSEFKLAESQARTIIMAHGVPMMFFVRYFNFVRYVVHARRAGCRTSAEGGAGSAFELEARAALARWSGAGCEPAILEQILEQVFNVKKGLAKSADSDVQLDGNGREIQGQLDDMGCGGSPQAGSREGRPGCPDESAPADSDSGGES